MSATRNIGIPAKAPTKDCDDLLCPWHGELPVRGRIIEGTVTSTKMRSVVTVRRDFLRLVSKYNRYERRHGVVSARIPPCIPAKVGDTVRVMECRHLSKTVSFAVVELIEKGV